MPSTNAQRRLGLILFVLGWVPCIAAMTFLASVFIVPEVGLVVFDLFVPPDIAHPDSWNVARARMAWLFIVTGSIGFVLSSLGFKLSRTPG